MWYTSFMRKILCVIMASLSLAGCQNQDIPQVVETQTFDPAVAVFYDNLNEIAEEADTVVQGKTVRLDYFMAPNGIIWTKQKFQVQEVLDGTVPQEEYINIYRMGGTISIDEYLASFPETAQGDLKRNYGSYDKEDLICQVYEDEEAVSIHQKEVVFLQHCDAFGNEPEDYWRVGGSLGELFETDEGNDVYSGYWGTYSVDEVRDMILQ